MFTYVNAVTERDNRREEREEDRIRTHGWKLLSAFMNKGKMPALTKWWPLPSDASEPAATQLPPTSFMAQFRAAFGR